jgi:hypothetical protein
MLGVPLPPTFPLCLYGLRLESGYWGCFPDLLNLTTPPKGGSIRQGIF